jgi:hypothetical protein
VAGANEVPAVVRAKDFLSAVYAGLDGFIEVRTMPPIEQGFFATDDLDALEGFIKPRRDRNCYIGVAVRHTAGDGSLAGCASLPALFCDIDFKNGNEADARARLTEFFVAPSAVIASGGGLQPWWFLREPMDLQSEALQAKQLLRRLAHALAADLAAAEPARILRVPNTRNFKYEPERRVLIESFQIAGTTPSILMNGFRLNRLMLGSFPVRHRMRFLRAQETRT